MVGYVVVGHGFGLSRPSWGPPFRVWIDPIVPQRLHQPKKSCVGVELVALASKMVVVTPEKNCGDCGTDYEPSRRSSCDEVGSLICVGGLLSLSMQLEF